MGLPTWYRSYRWKKIVMEQPFNQVPTTQITRVRTVPYYYRAAIKGPVATQTDNFGVNVH